MAKPPDCQRVRVWSAAIAAVLGGLTIIGWLSRIEALASVRARYIPMAPSTALAFALLGTALILGERHRWFLRLTAVLVASVAGAKLFEFLSGISLGIDEFFVADPAMFGQVRKGRMAPITALNFLLSAAACWTLLSPRLRASTGVAAAVIAGVAIVVVLGYVHGTPLLYGGHIIPVALPTAVAFLAIGVALIAAAGPACWPLRPWFGTSARALLLRWFLPIVAGLALIGGLLSGWLLQHTQVNPALLSAFSTLLFSAALVAIISQVANIVGGRIDRAEAELNLAQSDLEALNRGLEERIEERTRELRLKNDQMQEDLRMARELQLAMLPKQYPWLRGDASSGESAVRFCTFYYPAGGVSGDFFSIFPVSDDAVGVFICDVMGHGVRAALVTSMMRVLMEQHSAADADPGVLLTHINRGMTGILRQTGTTLFATSLVMVANIARGEIAFANAGHPNPIHIRRQSGTVESLGGRSGPALGIFPEAEYGAFRVPLSPSDLVLLFTDGLFEVENSAGDLYTYEDLLAAVQRRQHLPAQALCDELLAEVRQFAGKHEFADDVCLVGMEMAVPVAKPGREREEEAELEEVP